VEKQRDSLEAALVIQILQYTEWPPDQFEQDSRILDIGIYDSHDHASLFADMLQGSRFEKKVRLHFIDKDFADTDINGLEALYCPSISADQLQQVAKKTTNHAIALVGNFDGFFQQGGMINLLSQDNRITFEINQSRASTQGITFRAKLLRLAHRVIR